MKTLVLSDIHSNMVALEEIWAVERDSDLVICAGDLVDYGPYPKEVLDWVRSKNVACVQGNHDAWVVKNYRAGDKYNNTPVEERAWVHHNASLLDEEDIAYLEHLPQTLTFSLDKTWHCLTHLYQDYEEIVSLHAYRKFLAQITEDGDETKFSRLIMGHTHRQAVRILADEHLWLNPGSVAYRRRDDPDQTAHYAVIVDGCILLKRLAYDMAPLRRCIDQVQLMESEIRVARRLWEPREEDG